MLNIKITFVGGIHGVGKSFFCRQISREFKVEHVAASKLIGDYITNRIDKRVLDIDSNQKVLVQALTQYQPNQKNILLDGHFCLFNKDGNIQEITLGIFEKISPYVVFVLKDNPESIIQRLFERDKVKHNENLVQEMQDNELLRANYIAKQLKIPIEIIDVSAPFNILSKQLRCYFKED